MPQCSANSCTRDTKYFCITCDKPTCQVCSQSADENSPGYAEEFFHVGYCSSCSTAITTSSKKRQSTDGVDLSTIGAKKHRSISSFFTRIAKPTKNLPLEQVSTVNTKKSIASHMAPATETTSTKTTIEKRLRSVKGNTVESNWKKDRECRCLA